jgi:hypothetical protein
MYHLLIILLNDFQTHNNKQIIQHPHSAAIVRVDEETINRDVRDNFEGFFKRMSGLRCNASFPLLMIGDSWYVKTGWK